MSSASKVIVLTGCTRGLGRVLLDRFVAAGHQVIGCGRSEEGIAALQKSYGKPHDFSVLDVSNNGAVDDWSKRVIEEHGPPDFLINNAAVMNHPQPLWKISPKEFDLLIDINIKGVFYVIHSFLPAMVARKHGIVVNFSSGWGRSVDRDVAPYCATKWGIEGLTLALAEELPDGMAAIPLNPGVIDTDMLRSAWGDGAASAHRPEKWAMVAADYILSFGPEHNGQQLAVSLSGTKG